MYNSGTKEKIIYSINNVNNENLTQNTVQQNDSYSHTENLEIQDTNSEDDTFSQQPFPNTSEYQSERV